MRRIESSRKYRSIDERGFSLIDVMIAMGLATIAIVTTMAVITQASQVRRIEGLRTSVVGVREHLIKVLSRYDNFQETIHNNATFNCLRVSPYDCGTVDIAGWEAGTLATANNLSTAQFNIRLARSGGYGGGFTSEILYQASNLNAGFTDEGLNCLSTSAAPNRTCPIRVDLYWWNLCQGTCNPGLVGIKVIIRTYNDANKKTVTTPYGFNIIKSVFQDGQAGPFPDPP